MLSTRRDMLVKSAFLAAGMLAGCGKGHEPLLRIGTFLWPGHEPLNIARELNYLDQSIQVVEYSSTPEVHRSFQNKAIEAACITLDEALQLAQYESDVRAILALAISNGADALVAKPGTMSLNDLKGQRIGVQLNAVGSLILGRVLEKAALTAQDITIVPMAPEQCDEKFLKGEVDAVVTHEPYSSRIVEAGGVALFDSSQMPGEIVNVLVVRAETIASNRETLTNLLQGWFRAVDLCAKDRTKAARIGAIHHGITEDRFLRSLSRLELLTAQRNLQLLGEANGPLHDTVRKLGANMRKYQLLEKMVDPATLLDASILKRATT